MSVVNPERPLLSDWPYVSEVEEGQIRDLWSTYGVTKDRIADAGLGEWWTQVGHAFVDGKSLGRIALDYGFDDSITPITVINSIFSQITGIY